MIYDVAFQNGPLPHFHTFPLVVYPPCRDCRVSDLGLEEQQVPDAIGFNAGPHHPAWSQGYGCKLFQWKKHGGFHEWGYSPMNGL